MWWVKLGDFGITKRIDNEQTALRTRIGTAGYLAPEIEDDDFPDSEYTQAVDMWSLGCVIYTILARTSPFTTMSSKKKPFPKAALKLCSSADAVDLVQVLLAKDPAERPTAKNARSNKWLLESDEPLCHNVPSGSSQSLPLQPKGPVEHSAAGDPRSDRRLLDDALEQTVVGNSSQNQPLLSTRYGDPPQLPPSQPSSPAMRQRVFGISLEILFERDGFLMPHVIHQCIRAVDLFGREVEKIYGIGGDSSAAEELKSRFDTGISSRVRGRL